MVSFKSKPTPTEGPMFQDFEKFEKSKIRCPKNFNVHQKKLQAIYYSKKHARRIIRLLYHPHQKFQPDPPQSIFEKYVFLLKVN